MNYPTLDQEAAFKEWAREAVHPEIPLYAFVAGMILGRRQMKAEMTPNKAVKALNDILDRLRPPT